jgi:hypothetical protein
VALLIKVVILVWFFGWGFLLLKFPLEAYRILSFGRTPNPHLLKREKALGYMALTFGCLFVIEIILGMIR